MNIGINCGRIFEVGFNLGILNYIHQEKLAPSVIELYQPDLEKLKFSKIVKKFQRFNKTDESAKIAEKWCQFFLIKGFFAGSNFLREYINFLFPRSHEKQKNIEIVYCQCNFSGENSFGLNLFNSEFTEDQYLRKILQQFDSHINPETLNIEPYKKLGEFLKADTLLLLKIGRRQWKIIAIDQSIFAIKTEKDLSDLSLTEEMRKQLIYALNYLRSKSIFSELGIDTHSLNLPFPEHLSHYLQAFQREDKESFKVIQAGSYAYSFYQFLLHQKILSPEHHITLHAIGYTDRGINSICVNPEENLQILETCYHIYQNKNSQSFSHQSSRENLLQQIQMNAKRSFQDGRKFIDNLFNKSLEKKTGITLIQHQEILQDFDSSVSHLQEELATELDLPQNLTLRQAHSKLIERALEDPQIFYLFLTGNPGIGKTTTIVKFLQEHIDEGFLFFYISPRIQVNLDIINKFQDEPGKLCHDSLICLNSNAYLIKENSKLPTVKYVTNTRQDNFRRKSIYFIGDETNLNFNTNHPQSRIGHTTEKEMNVKSDRISGVLSSLCQGINEIIIGNDPFSNNIIATAAVQSLKQLEGDKNTLCHFEKIFSSVSRDSKPIPAKMSALRQRIKNIFIMIDEITGDDSGVQFFIEIEKIIKKYQLTEHGFQVKIITADASLVDKSVIKDHLDQSDPEPNKIFFRCAQNPGFPLVYEEFTRQKKKAIFINANSYPASQLTLNYNILMELAPYQESRFVKQDEKHLIEALQKQLLKDIQQYLSEPKNQQILVYIQDKRRLRHLIEALEKEYRFIKNRDYLEIHADISPQEKQDIENYKYDAKIIFMTASASRGISFPKATILCVDIPRFEVEKNLMEVIQFIYRGRGEDRTGQTLDHQEKSITFYLGERCIYSQNEDQQIRESILNLINILLILKTSIMTRIKGSGVIGKKNYLMIPIGGKSISSVGESFSVSLANLINQLQKEYRKDRHRIDCKNLIENLESLLKNADIFVKNLGEKECKNYLDLRRNFTQEFTNAVTQGLQGLLDWRLETGYVCGSLLVVPLTNQNIEERYYLELRKFRKSLDSLLTNMYKIRQSSETNNNLKSALNTGIDFLKKLQEDPETQDKMLRENYQASEYYYAFPLLAFTGHEELKKYFESNSIEPEDQKFREILARYLYRLYPVSNTLPIGNHYREFPFILFSSYSLKELRKKLFNRHYLLNSHELNVLNLILSSPDPS